MSRGKIDRLNFYTHLYKEIKGGSIEVRMIDADSRVKRKFYDLKSFKKDLPSMAFPIDTNCYFAIATRNGGGTKDHISQIPALWCDIDFKNTDQKDTDKRLTEIPSIPSAIIESGNGYHLYWFLKEPLEKSDIPLVESLNSRLAQYFEADPSPAEAARVLRIPGTANIKYDPARLVNLKSLNPTFRYNPDDFEKWLPAYPASAHARACKNERIHSRTGRNTNRNILNPEAKQTETFRNKRNISFEEGFRDESLFHIANCLHRGGMNVENISEILCFIGVHCTPPFPDKEIEAKLDSVLKRSDRADMGLTEQLRSFISETWGAFSVTEAKQNVTSETSHNLQPKIRSILSRIARTEGIIEPIPDKSGWYRKVENQCEPEDWQNACIDTVNLKLPFDLTNMALIPPGGLICIAGEPNAGKTAILLNIAKENRQRWNVHYFSSELGSGAFKRRVSKFGDITPNQFNVNFYPRSDNFSDVIKKGEGNLNIIDYLEIYENFYLVSKHLADIYKKLNGAVAVIALQKNPGQDDGRGGTFTREKPTLSLAVSPGKVKITKLKEWREDVGNPNNMEYHFKLVDGCRFIKKQGWHRPIN